MNRRIFLKSTAGVAAALAASPILLSTTGCLDKNTVIADINVIINSAENIIAVAEPNAPWLASMQAAITKLEQAETTWQSGGAVNIVIDALNAIAAVTAVIPITAPYSALIDIVVAGVEAVIAVLIPQQTTNVTLMTSTQNPHIGRVRIDKLSKNGYRKQFNDAAKLHGYPQAQIQ